MAKYAVGDTVQTQDTYYKYILVIRDISHESIKDEEYARLHAEVVRYERINDKYIPPNWPTQEIGTTMILLAEEVSIVLKKEHAAKLEIPDAAPDAFGSMPSMPGNVIQRAPDFCTNAARLMEDRGKERDKPTGERSMAKAVEAFNTIYDQDLTETQGWQFMSILKKVRGSQGNFRMDDYEDDVAYCALAAEAATEEKHNGS